MKLFTMIFLLVSSIFVVPPTLGIPEVAELPNTTRLHLVFHMGIGANSKFFVGGTLENKGDQEVYQGYIVITPLSSDCYPKSPQLWPFGKIMANSKFEFKVPIEGKLEGYKLDLVYAMDSFGNKVKVIDETESILNSKQADYVAKCQLRRTERVN